MTELQMAKCRLIDLATFDHGTGKTFIGDPCYPPSNEPGPRERWADTTTNGVAEITHRQSGRRFQLADDGRGGRLTEVE